MVKTNKRLKDNDLQKPHKINSSKERKKVRQKIKSKLYGFEKEEDEGGYFY